MSKIEVDTIAPQSGTTVTLGESGDTITVPTGATLDASNATTTLPANVVTTDGTQTLTNKSIAATQLTGTITPSDGTVTNAKIVDSTIELAKLTATGTKDATTFLRGDNTFQTVSSDYVLLSSTTPSPANTFSIDGHFTSDYDIYKIYGIGMSGSSMSNTRLSFRVNVGGTVQTGSNYYYMGYIFQNGSSNIGWSNSSSGSYSDIGYVHSSTGSTAQGNFEMTIYRPLASDKTAINTDMLAWDNGTTFLKTQNHTAWNVAQAISGITLGVGAFGTGNIEADRILVYGLKI